MRLWLSLPDTIESGMIRAKSRDKAVVDTDGGYEVRNTRWSGPLRNWQTAFGYGNSTDVNFAAVEAMWDNTDAGVDTFNFTDPKSNDLTQVRFDGPLQYTHDSGPLYHLDSFALKEVRDVSPLPTVLPAITGTIKVGSVATLSNGTWTGSPPASYAYQWLLNDVANPGAISSTYTPVSGDAGKMLGGYVIATDAYGGQTRVLALDVGPIAP